MLTYHELTTFMGDTHTMCSCLISFITFLVYYSSLYIKKCHILFIHH